MKVIHSATELVPGNRKVCLAIGFFDGVHLGHQQIIRQTVADARQHDGLALVLTFDQHPNTVVAPERVPPLIYSLPQKIRTIEALGNDVLLQLRFDRAFSQQTGEAFVRQLARNLGRILSVRVGADFAFGYKRSGDVKLLNQLGSELQFTVHGIAAVALDGKLVSSTRIREAIRNGNFEAANQMLGRTYALSGRVIKGERIGHRLGFPTANIDTTGLVLPPRGVYTVHVQTGAQLHPGVLNIGVRPTLHADTPRTVVETHLLDFTGDLYGQELEIMFGDKLRDEKKFDSEEELKAQIAHDVREARARS